MDIVELEGTVEVSSIGELEKNLSPESAYYVFSEVDRLQPEVIEEYLLPNSNGCTSDDDETLRTGFGQELKTVLTPLYFRKDSEEDPTAKMERISKGFLKVHDGDANRLFKWVMDIYCSDGFLYEETSLRALFRLKLYTRVLQGQILID